MADSFAYGHRHTFWYFTMSLWIVYCLLIVASAKVKKCIFRLYYTLQSQWKDLPVFWAI